MIALLVVGMVLLCSGAGFVAFAKTGGGDELDRLLEIGGYGIAFSGAVLLLVREAVLGGWFV